MLLLIFDGGPEATIQDLRERLPAHEPRYVLFKYHMPLGERGDVDRMCLMMYVPHGTPVRMRTIYPGNARPFESDLTGIQHKLEVERSTLVDADIQEKLRKTITDAYITLLLFMPPQIYILLIIFAHWRGGPPE
eukprot:EC789733.1.p1 GENE.EC789733.1~~EC789733.1.p1  ORF type:complete len:134 (+),score=1.20 EC789733.1:105-506(+)